MEQRIDDYALISDRHSAALVSRDGSIDFLCWPRFDSDACFAALLGDERNGCWRLASTDPAARTSRCYRGDTLIVQTTHTTAEGRVQVLDLMPIGAGRAIIRRVTGEAGVVEMTSTFHARFDYGRVPPWSRVDGNTARCVAGPDLLVLRSDVPLESREQRIVATFRVGAGETVSFTLQYGLSFAAPPEPLDATRLIADTEAHWRDWLAHAAFATDCDAAVRRSLLTLRALVHAETGGIIAAPTLSLPEIPGGAANWDYRFCWLRDATFALRAFLNTGLDAEAIAWRDWLLRAAAGDPAHMRTMYRFDGARHIEHQELPWLAGFNGARPVRAGNAAVTQLQLDIFGEVLDTLHTAREAGVPDDRPLDIRMDAAIAAHIARIWEQPDHGIWETRGEPRHYTYSKVMAWVGIDRFLRLSHADPAVDATRRAAFEALRQRMHERICRDGLDPSGRHFVRWFGADSVDASLLRLPLVGFLPIDDPRIAATIAAVEHDLVEDGLVRRHTPHGPGPHEGAFIACTCWLADCLAMQGRMAAARDLLRRVLALRNDVGLLAEEWDRQTGRAMGNFPQALSHLALINTAVRLGRG